MENSITNSQIGMLIAFANIFSVLIQPVIAGLIDRSGTRMMLCYGVGACVIGAVMTALAVGKKPNFSKKY